MMRLPNSFGRPSSIKIFAVVFEAWDGDHISMHQRQDNMKLEAVEEIANQIYRRFRGKIKSVEGPMTAAEYWERDAKIRERYRGRIPLEDLTDVKNRILVNPEIVKPIHESFQSLRSILGHSKRH